MKRMVCLMMTLLLAAACLTACGASGGGGAKDSGKSTPAISEEKGAEKVVHGTINRIDNYLVLLTDDGEYQIMDFGDGVTLDDYAEGDQVNVTYTGELGVEGSNPVITAIAKAK